MDRRKLSTKIAVFGLLLVAAFAVFAACDTEDDATTPTTQPDATNTPAAGETPTTGETPEATNTPTTGETPEATSTPAAGETPEPTETSEPAALPGEGTTVQPARATWNTGYFQEALYSAGLEDLGYTVEDAQELDNPIFYQSVAQGDVHYWANGWFPLHNQYEDAYSQGAEIAGTVAEGGALEGYLVNASAVEELGVDSLDDFTDPDIKDAFDGDGDGKADLYGCPPGWGCNTVIEHHLDDLGLTDHINHITAGYSTSMADAVARFENGENILFYTWTPNWTVNVLAPGEDVMWIALPEPSYPEEIDDERLSIAGVEGAVEDPLLMGFPANDINVVANSEFLENNPAAATLFQLIEIPLDDIFEQNARMNEGEDSQADIDRHAQEWIEENQDQWDQWIEEAIAAAS